LEKVMVLSHAERVGKLYRNDSVFCGLVLIRADSRFFSGILHPHLLGDCRPNLFLPNNSMLANPNQRADGKHIEEQNQIRVRQMNAAA
jgi:hypothetical protein